MLRIASSFSRSRRFSSCFDPFASFDSITGSGCAVLDLRTRVCRFFLSHCSYVLRFPCEWQQVSAVVHRKNFLEAGRLPRSKFWGSHRKNRKAGGPPSGVIEFPLRVSFFGVSVICYRPRRVTRMIFWPCWLRKPAVRQSLIVNRDRYKGLNSCSSRDCTGRSRKQQRLSARLVLRIKNSDGIINISFPYCSGLCA